jgi:hypothetical protein
VPSIPDAWFDGVDEYLGASGDMFPTYSAIVTANIAEGSPIVVKPLARYTSATAGTLYVHIDVANPVTTTNNVVHYVIVEEGLATYGTTPGLARDMLVDHAFTLTSPGQSVDLQQPFTLSGSWKADDIAFVAWVQTNNVPRTVLQAARCTRGNGIVVTPRAALAASGPVGGPFTPSSVTYEVENPGPGTMGYTVTATQPWLTITNGTGTIPSHSSVEVTVELNVIASLLGGGVYTDALTFTNTTDGIGNCTRQVRLEVGRTLVYSFPLDTNPGWTTTGLWAFGRPIGGGGAYGNPDPMGGHTGTNVYGYNLNGDYENNLPERHLTTPALDLTGYDYVEVRFWRWLGVEQPQYDHAYFRASKNGTSWTTIWTNTATIEDDSWTEQVYDVSSVGARSTLYLRWTMGTTDSSWQYCGWNIDDIEIWGIAYTPSGVADPDATAGVKLLAASPNPFREAATIAYGLPAAGRVTVGVYDVAGRLVRNVVDGPVEAGLHAAQWDGRDASSRPVAAGVYFCRIVALGETDTRSMVLLK